MKRTEAIKAFLTARTHPDLAALYNSGMECQVNVAQDGGSRITGEFRGKNWHGYTDGIVTWKPIRIPRNAHTTPEYEDVKMTFSLDQHAEAIGMTGWDWKNRVSKWVAFDFDAIVGHKSGGVSEENLEAIKVAAQEIPWVTVRKSSGGRGLHIYVFLDPPPKTANHNEHAALARAIIGKMSALVRFDFESKVDICGGNMWVFHRKMVESGGLTLIKQGIPLAEVPPQWKDHLKVITGHRRKTLPTFLLDNAAEDSISEAERFFLDLTSQMPRIPLDEDHKRLIQWLEEHHRHSWWDNDHHMLVTHTFDLKEAHQELGLRGIFDTLATGKDKGQDWNCFAFPMRRGGWSIRRYTMGIQEHLSWDQDGKGWTRCYYNKEPDLQSASRSLGGAEDTDGAFVFKEAEIAVDAARKLGAKVPDLPRTVAVQKASLKEHKDGRVILAIDSNPDLDATAGQELGKLGFLNKRSKWLKIFNVNPSSPTESEVGNYDDIVRHLTTTTGEDYGWVIKGEGASWRTEPLIHVRTSLESMNLTPKDVKMILGTSVLRPWRLVNRPFQPEFPGERQWNRGAAQFRFIPKAEVDQLEYGTWMKILQHCGQGLDEALSSHPWARANGITSGADYLKIWISSAFKEPYEPLPYLFFHGPEDSGKSIFHEALSLLVTHGYKRADSALINPTGFNEELANAIFCVVEEINLSKSRDANNRIKDWVTAREISIHPKGRTPYHIPNTTHWIQCSNDTHACPTFPGDTRITTIFVDTLPIDSENKSTMIPKKLLLPMLEKEAPDFLAEILRIEIPPSNDRLNVPIVATAAKLEAQRANESLLQTFFRERVYHVDGEMISKGEFHAEFSKWCPEPAEMAYWTKQRISKEFPATFPQGRSRQNGQHYYGNVSFMPWTPDMGKKAKLRAVLGENQRDWFLEPDGHAGNNNKTSS